MLTNEMVRDQGFCNGGATVRISDYPQLKALCWNRKNDARITEREAFQLYSRNWRHINPRRLGADETAFITGLKASAGIIVRDLLMPQD